MSVVVNPVGQGSALSRATASSAVAAGCGRVFEGSMEQMWNSLKKLRALPFPTIAAVNGVAAGAADAHAGLALGTVERAKQPGPDELLVHACAIYIRQ